MLPKCPSRSCVLFTLISKVSEDLFPSTLIDTVCYYTLPSLPIRLGRGISARFPFFPIHEIEHLFIHLKAVCVCIHNLYICMICFSSGLLVFLNVKEINPLNMSCKSPPPPRTFPFPASFLSFELLLCLLFQSRFFCMCVVKFISFYGPRDFF